MPFQKQVNNDFPTAMPGQDYGLQPNKHTAKTAGDGGVTCGKFVYLADEDTVVSTGAADAAPYGLVALTHYQSRLGYGEDASLLIPEGEPASICTRGEKWVVSSTAAEAGWQIFANPLTGDISAAAAAAAGYVATGWKAVKGGEAGTLIPISTWR